MTERTINTRLKKLIELEAQKKALERQIEDIKSSIQSEMGQNEELETPKYLVRYTFVVSKRFDSKTFQKDHPKMYDQYRTESSYRRFSVNEK